ncbi:FHA domain-containing protein [Skermanella sp. TT6]|uniref:FHA domain-containing protein n=1 Tax=Skermanella cutis TaxID=2775420 RepID=A0ABX7BC23_9PROT|nr:adenylate/guanylate cyclase domain-containing protein [Skermanella sp. TT6]QQP91926.1 FHA domain-containing protein [Skermanella sp. TT6]
MAVQSDETMAVMFADVCDSTRLYQVLGDAAAHALTERCVGQIIEATERYSGTVVKTMGDGALSTFPSADTAYCAAAHIQEALRGTEPKVRIGFTIGPVIVTPGDVFGATVNLASRLAALASPGEVLMTRACVDALHPAYRPNTQRLDSAVVKGGIDAVEIYRTLGDPENVTVAAGQLDGASGKRRGILILTHRGRQLRLDTGSAPVLMGRDGGCGLVINSDWASRRHATLEIMNGRFTLTDHSTNGTFCLDESQRLLVLKREPTYLLTSGLISLGIAPAEDPDNVIRYRCGTIEGEAG